MPAAAVSCWCVASLADTRLASPPAIHPCLPAVLQEPASAALPRMPHVPLVQVRGRMGFGGGSGGVGGAHIVWAKRHLWLGPAHRCGPCLTLPTIPYFHNPAQPSHLFLQHNPARLPPQAEDRGAQDAVLRLPRQQGQRVWRALRRRHLRVMPVGALWCAWGSAPWRRRCNARRKAYGLLRLPALLGRVGALHRHLRRLPALPPTARCCMAHCPASLPAGENIDEVRSNPNWLCPACRQICNCSGEGWAAEHVEPDLAEQGLHGVRGCYSWQHPQSGDKLCMRTGSGAGAALPAA